MCWYQGMFTICYKIYMGLLKLRLTFEIRTWLRITYVFHASFVEIKITRDIQINLNCFFSQCGLYAKYVSKFHLINMFKKLFPFK